MDDDDFSDLTDIESDEYLSKPKKSSAKSKSGPGSGYRIRNALKVPRATTYTAQALHQQMHSGEINKDPDYQRDVVWPETKMVGIIDSIFRNFYIPPIIFAVTSHEDGTETKVCIDGKQRLTSIQKFMDGLIAHKDPITNEKLYYTDISAGHTKSSRPKHLLPEKYRRLFANKQIVCVEYQDITDQDEREIFQRVQLGMALTPAEKLQVINTPRATFIRTLQQRFLKEQDALSGEYLDWERSRGSDFRCLAQIVFCLDNWNPALKGAGSILKLEKWLSEETEFPASFKDGVLETFKLFSEISVDRKLGQSLRNSKYANGKISPIEFVCVGLLIGVCGAGVVGTAPGAGGYVKGKMRLEEMGVAIGKMRECVRDEHVDIRMNDRVAKTMLDFIRNAGGLKRKRTSEDGELSEAEIVKATSRKAPGAVRGSTLASAVGVVGPSSSSSVTAVSSSSAAAGKAKAATAAPKPDRMAALRAAKMQAGAGRTGGGSFSVPTSQPPPLPPPPLPLSPAPQQQQQHSQLRWTPTLTPHQPAFVAGSSSGGQQQVNGSGWAAPPLDLTNPRPNHQGSEWRRVSFSGSGNSGARGGGSGWNGDTGFSSNASFGGGRR